MHSLILHRMRAANPNEFEPKLIFFSDSPAVISDDAAWRNCFTLKASAVYSSITGAKHVDPQTISVASNLLILIAVNCIYLVPALRNSPAATHFPTIMADGALEGAISRSVMNAVDIVYLVVGFLRDFMLHARTSTREDVDAYFISTNREKIVIDMIKTDNQLPSDMIIDVVDRVEEAIRTTKHRLLETKKVGENDSLLLSLEQFDLSFKKDTFHRVINKFCWYYSPFFSSLPRAGDFQSISSLSERENLLDCLHSTLIIRKVINSHLSGSKTTTPLQNVPAVAKLVKSGVRLVTEDSGFVQVKFVPPVLRFPALIYDFKMETVARNLLAWELASKEKPMTQYFQLMKDLIDDVGDVSAMKNGGVLRGDYKNEELIRFLKTTDEFAKHPSAYPDADAEMAKVVQFYEVRMKSFFLRNRSVIIYGASTAAAMSVLLAAAVVLVRRRAKGSTVSASFTPASQLRMLVKHDPREQDIEQDSFLSGHITKERL